MSEKTAQDTAPQAEATTTDGAETSPVEPTAKKAARRRAPRRDEVLAAAVDAARAGLDGLAAEDQVGEHRGATVDDDRLMTHRWDAKLPGYRGWQWYSTVARAPRSKHVTVCETGLTAGEDAIVAPPWVPYADRVSEEERERMKAVAEGRDPNRPAEGGSADEATTDEATTDEESSAASADGEQASGQADEAASSTEEPAGTEASGQDEEAAVVVTEEAPDAPAEQAADPDPAPETDSAPDAEASEAEEEPAQES